MSIIERAIEIATLAHVDQVDRGGQPYILHPLRVMRMVTTVSEQLAAVLHDVVEDTDWTFEALAAEGFPDEVIEALRALTKTKGEDKMVAAQRAAEHSIARNVKLADVCDNMNLARIPQPTEKDFARQEKYKQVRSLLIEHGATLPFHQTCGRD